jgi:hypothetical protein
MNIFNSGYASNKCRTDRPQSSSDSKDFARGTQCDQGWRET